MTKRERRRRAFLAQITEGGRSRAEGVAWAAELLDVSTWAVEAWLKPETSKSSNPVPPWAIELLKYKLADRR